MLKIHVLDSLLRGRQLSYLELGDVTISKYITVRQFYAQRVNSAHTFLSFSFSVITH